MVARGHITLDPVSALADSKSTVAKDKSKQEQAASKSAQPGQKKDGGLIGKVAPAKLTAAGDAKKEKEKSAKEGSN